MTQEGLPHVLVFSLEKATGTTWALGRESRPLRFFNRHVGQQPAAGADLGGQGGVISRLDRPQEVEEIASPKWVARPSDSRKSLPSRDPFFNILRILKHNQLNLFSIPSKSTAFSE